MDSSKTVKSYPHGIHPSGYVDRWSDEWIEEQSKGQLAIHIRVLEKHIADLVDERDKKLAMVRGALNVAQDIITR